VRFYPGTARVNHTYIDEDIDNFISCWANFQKRYPAKNMFALMLEKVKLNP